MYLYFKVTPTLFVTIASWITHLLVYPSCCSVRSLQSFSYKILAHFLLPPLDPRTGTCQVVNLQLNRAASLAKLHPHTSCHVKLLLLIYRRPFGTFNVRTFLVWHLEKKMALLPSVIIFTANLRVPQYKQLFLVRSFLTWA